MKQGCVYHIFNTVTKKSYVGSTWRVKARWGDHIRMLRQNRHHSRKLQSSYNRHGESAFKFVVLETCTSDKLEQLEQFWLDSLDAYNGGYNTLADVTGTDPFTQSQRTAKRWANPTQREKQSKLMKSILKRPGFLKSREKAVQVAQKKRWTKAARAAQSKLMLSNNYNLYKHLL